MPENLTASVALPPEITQSQKGENEKAQELPACAKNSKPPSETAGDRLRRLSVATNKNQTTHSDDHNSWV